MKSPLHGRWDVTILRPGQPAPTWFELEEGPEGWSGRFVGVVGSARPIAKIETADTCLRFSLPRQYEWFDHDLEFAGELVDGVLYGTTVEDRSTPWVAHRAPDLPKPSTGGWGDPIDLLADGLEGWMPRPGSLESKWTMEGGSLVNPETGADLVTLAHFRDFRLEAEYSYPAGANSGIYLRGRYEIQVLDDHGSRPHVGSSGGVYGFHAPRTNPIHPAGERNLAVISLLGRHVEIDLNGIRVVEGEIPGITGGALDSAEGAPGPIFLQGDHGPVTYHRLTLTPWVLRH
ncbi:MAG: DUF1080 domain-containing protein [Fimbriimonadaceae bacterium]|nr:DUF1080 domain-containing protein [Fimbriimonadaceae bacterium]